MAINGLESDARLPLEHWKAELFPHLELEEAPGNMNCAGRDS